jgi:hypothetical protein
VDATAYIVSRSEGVKVLTEKLSQALQPLFKHSILGFMLSVVSSIAKYLPVTLSPHLRFKRNGSAFLGMAQNLNI